ncbi:MAG: hypothetical protein AAF984_03300 [Verrucomicrobiota bacterium]
MKNILLSIRLQGIVALICCSFGSVVQAQGNETQTRFFHTYLMIQKAEELERLGKLNEALELYNEVHQRLEQIKTDNPKWEYSVVNYRIKHVKNIITELDFRTGSSSSQNTDEENEKASQKQENEMPVIEDGSLRAGVSPPLTVTASTPQHQHQSEPAEIIRRAQPVDDFSQEPSIAIAPPEVTLDQDTFDRTIESLRTQFHDALTQLSESKKQEGDLRSTIAVFKKENTMLADEYNRYRDQAEQEKAELTERNKIYQSENRMMAQETQKIRSQAEEAQKKADMLSEQIAIYKSENKMLAQSYQEANDKAEKMENVASGTVVEMERVRMQIGSLRSLMQLRRDSIKALLAQDTLKHDASTRKFLLQLEDISAKSEALLRRLETKRAVMEVKGPRLGGI